eukprot:2510469-Ditylum_brightwellii.AAC.1
MAKATKCVPLWMSIPRLLDSRQAAANLDLFICDTIAVMHHLRPVPASIRLYQMLFGFEIGHSLKSRVNQTAENL